MESTIVRHLAPEFEPVALVWSETIPADGVQLGEGRFGCILHLLAQASTRGKLAGGSRETIVCPGGRMALGLGTDLVASDAEIEHYAAVFSKGLAATPNREAYRARMDAARPIWRPLYEHGERRHCSFETARDWLLHQAPRYDTPTRYVLFKPLSRTTAEDWVRAVIFLVRPLELAGLVTLLGSVVEGADPVQAPPGPDCFRVAGFVHAQHDATPPRAVLGMLDVDGRELMKRRFRSDTLSLALPMPLFRRLEAEAGDSVLQTPGWQGLRSC
jgi:hypothetical protein